RLPPKSFWWSLGFGAPFRLLNQELASSLSLRRMSNAVPWKALAPDLVVKLSTPPVVLPNSAGIVEVVTLNSFRASTDGAFSSKVEPSSAWTMLAPSRITSVLKFCPPESFDSNTPEEGESLLVPGPIAPGVRNTKDSTDL